MSDLRGMRSGWGRIADERVRQIDAEGYYSFHDDDHTADELARAADCYLNAEGPDCPMPGSWPWPYSGWNPKDRISNLVRAGALIAAEIDRLQRLAKRQEGGRVVIPSTWATLRSRLAKAGWSEQRQADARAGYELGYYAALRQLGQTTTAESMHKVWHEYYATAADDAKDAVKRIKAGPKGGDV